MPAYDVTLTLDTNAYASGDLLADTQLVSAKGIGQYATGVIDYVQVLDKDDQGIALDLVFLDRNTTLGTENSAPSVTDAEALAGVVAVVSIVGGDYVDLGGCRIAEKRSVNAPLYRQDGATGLYVAAITRGTPTHSAAGVRVRVGIK